MKIIGPQVFRFEYCYLLRDGTLSNHAASSMSSGIAAIIVDIAVIDPKSKVLLGTTSCANSARCDQLIDWGITTAAGCPLSHNRQDSGPLRTHSGRTHSMGLQPCRALRFPVFDFTNAIFISPRLLYDYFALPICERTSRELLHLSHFRFLGLYERYSYQPSSTLLTP